MAPFLRSLLVVLFLTTCVQRNADAAESPRIHIVLVGDSTVGRTYGWGNAFLGRLRAGATGTNLGHNGTTSASFRALGDWDKVLAEHPTHVLIQFGHNDSHNKGSAERETDANTKYRDQLMRYITDARAAGVQPILVTSLVRRTFSGYQLDDLLGPYANAVVALGKEQQVPVVDLHARSFARVEKLGPADCAPFSPTTKDGKVDRTHLTPAGGEVFAGLVVEELLRVVPTLEPYLATTP